MTGVLQKVKRAYQQQNLDAFLQSLNYEDIRLIECNKKIRRYIVRLLKRYRLEQKETEVIRKFTSMVNNNIAQITSHQGREDLLSQKARCQINDMSQYVSVEQHSCLGCLKYLISEKELPSTKQIYTMLGKDYNDQILKQFIKIKSCALLNTRRGGYVFLTAQQNQMECIIGTQQFSSANNFQTWKQVIKDSVINSIFPKNYQLIIDEIQVVTEDMKLTKKSVIRVTLISEQSTSLYVIDKKFEHTKKESIACGFINPSRLGTRDDVIKTQNTAWIYQFSKFNFILDHRQKKKHQPIRRDGHQISCLQFDLVKATQSFEELNLIINQYSKNLITKVENQELKFTFKNFTLLVFATQAGNQNAEKLRKEMEIKKQNFYLTKPFEYIAHKSIKSIWYLGHDCQFQTVIDLFKKFIFEDRYMPTPITLTKYIQIKNQPPSPIEQYLKNYESTFNLQPEYFRTNQNKLHERVTYDYNFKFESFKYTIYSYIYLDNQRIKCLLIKQSIFKVEKQKYLANLQQ